MATLEAAYAAAAGTASTVELLASGIELALEVMEQIALWVGQVIQTVRELIKMLGACIAGLLIYRLAKIGAVLGLDGVRESAVYVAGVDTPLEGRVRSSR
jgi:hypothetical protein